jgi:hypothetical protein
MEGSMKTVAFAVLVLSLVWLPGCSSVSVTSDFDPSADFSGLKTYQWVKLQGTEDALERAPLLQKRAMIAVDRALAAKGYEKLATGAPDFFVAVHAGTKDKINVTSYGYGYGGWYGRPYGAGGGTTDVSYYTEGSIFIDIIRAKGDEFEMIWRGIGKGTVNPPSDPVEGQAKADEVAEQILEQFPPERN